MLLHAATLIVSDPFTQVFISVPLQYPLHVAAGQGDLHAVKALVGRGADINAKGDNGVSTYKGNLMKTLQGEPTLLFDIITKGLFL